MEPMPDDENGHGLGPSRTRVLAVLQDAGRPMTAHEVGDRLGMHPNSVRFHLDALAVGNDVVRDLERRSTPGRPSVTYEATSKAPPVARRRFPLLARLLAGVMREQLTDPACASEEAGRDWSRSLPVSRRPDSETSEVEALDILTGSLHEVGFESRAVDDANGLRVEISHCPFLEVAVDYEDVVCGLHRGLMRGVLEQLRAPIEVRGLEPLVEPGLCLARLSRKAS
jgi:predicted ArsR family transcriptional regulator